MIDFLIKTFEKNLKNEAIVWNDKAFSYEWLLQKKIYWSEKIKKKNINSGMVVIVEADFSPNSVSLMLALIEHGCIFVPLTKSVKDNRENFIKIAQGEFLFEID